VRLLPRLPDLLVSPNAEPNASGRQSSSLGIYRELLRDTKGVHCVLLETLVVNLAIGRTTNC
jgi:hypothetical protein